KRINFKFGNNFIFGKLFENKENVKHIKSFVRFQKKKRSQVVVYIDYIYTELLTNTKVNGLSIFDHKVKHDIKGQLKCKDPSKKDVPRCETRIEKSKKLQCLNNGQYLILNLKALNGTKIITSVKKTCTCSHPFFGSSCEYSSRCFNILRETKHSRCKRALYQTGVRFPTLKGIYTIGKCVRGDDPYNPNTEIYTLPKNHEQISELTS
ncbi:hypothetical protein MXB_1646, partial [Myxobolus squamalis]